MFFRLNLNIIKGTSAKKLFESKGNFFHFWKTFKFAASLFHHSHQSPLDSAEVFTLGTHSCRLRLSCMKNHGLLFDKMGERCIAQHNVETNKWDKNNY